MPHNTKRLTKVIATLGPASTGRLEEMIEAGVNVFRLNFSHKGASTEEVRQQLESLIKSIRAAGEKCNKPVAIMGDLQGPKFRIGELKDHKAIVIKAGEKLKFSVGTEIGDTDHIYTKNAPVINDLSVGHRVLLDDGQLELKVLERYDKDNILCEVIVGGKLGEKKGINVPDIVVSSKLSEKDKDDAKFAVQQGLDYVCCSFVQTADDVIELREFMIQHAPKEEGNTTNPSKIQKHVAWTRNLPLIISKIEKPQAVDNIQAILEATDGIMVARGDLGVEMSLERVPSIQKQLIEASNLLQKPVITATQMLESMIEKPVPTRAEVSDVANAVFDGSDAVMLSAESAVGAYPVQTVQTMVRIIEEAEKDVNRSAVRRRNQIFLEMQHSLQGHKEEEEPFHQTIAQTAASAARRSGSCAIVVLSYSGLMAMRVSKYKPDVPVIAMTPSKVAYRRMALLGYVHPILFNFETTVDATLKAMEAHLLKEGFLAKGDKVVLCTGHLDTLPGLNNTIKLYNFGEISA